AATTKLAMPIFKQYREADGRFHFKLDDGQGRTLLQSGGYDSPQEAGQTIARIRAARALGDDDSALLADGASAAEVERALAMLAAAEAAKARD
ncbi:MAG TPA: DUF1508 domain-containing protein, partial [Xanthomonadaceae bacterium]|nr:DUF1508 domain-containing protein [Xanthomonadaceae bacterium]